MPLIGIPKNLIDFSLRNRLLKGNTRQHLQGCRSLVNRKPVSNRV